MGMTLDEAIRITDRDSIMDSKAEVEARHVIIDAVRKYQKIVGIVSLNDEEFKQCGLKELKEILEVIADGNDD